MTESVALVVENTRKRPYQYDPSTKTVTVRKDIKSLFKKVATLTFSNAMLKKNADKARSDSERLAKESFEKLARAEEEIARLRAALEASEKKLFVTDETLIDAFEKLDIAADEAIIQTRGELMRQYLLCHYQITVQKIL
ncbi:hypothetical protein Ddye_020155 [Dipteronia dyeriana]|uniref:Uncharacterized protein n=1 Tax=Dipteronia dyeriana TaxID=168575 RepID=A0AAD9TZ78_9ROSI|nr:hypothetical protein Ddye_020155 [Dipteronia dyeriana]